MTLRLASRFFQTKWFLRGKEQDGHGAVRTIIRVRLMHQLGPSTTQINFDHQSSGTDHTSRLIHQYVRWDNWLGSDGPKGKGYGLARTPLDQSAFSLDHPSWLGEWDGEDGLWFGWFGRLDVVPALAPFRTLAG
ncbi:hypothetical protein IGI04_023165 [Brassica rapa subsp. trilocularis]|uniref:Neprosin domain-containing protein n=1 Tax=Brassica rapa subsp. trilocularis TaxID=1813537 RepID=A0ABQ7M328_BRACM|nr:hypothetical protein IGI04_023165 [Brassica rapa subsp. trilocularis]